MIGRGILHATPECVQRTPKALTTSMASLSRGKPSRRSQMVSYVAESACVSIHPPRAGAGQEPACAAHCPRRRRAAAGDGVFMRLMALPKGRGMLTRALRVLYAPPSLFEAVPGACLLCTPVHVLF